MTLVKRKPRRPSAADRQRVGRHRHHGHHYVKTYWPYLPIVAILAFGLVANGWLGQLHRSVLGYATDMSTASLLSDTNSQRAANGEGALNLNSALNQAAQAKANDMAARDYWSHNTPDGQTPWSFMTAAGYGYQTAGENLAYGFATATETLTGWMNSSEHRANILNTSYRDVGFGFVNIANYQSSGPETLVVAMYGSLPGEGPLAAPVSVAPANTPKPVVHPTPTPSPTPVPSPAPAAAPQADTLIATTTPAVRAAPSTSAQNSKMSNEPKQQRISRIQLVAAGSSSLGVFMAGVLAIGGLAFVSLRHGLAWRKVLVRGEQFAVRHPLLDVLVVSLVALSFIVSRTAGLIR